MHVLFPEKGLSKKEVLKQLQEYAGKDPDWKKGRTFSLVFYPGEEIADLLMEAYQNYFFENALNPSVFQSLKRMESEVVSMTASLLNAPEGAAGSMTSGGTESIMCAMKAAKKYARTKNKNIGQPNIVIPVTAHPAFLKAADYLDIAVKIVRCTGDDLVPDLKHFNELIDANTIMIVGSAPSYPHGLIDPLKDISKMAVEKNVWMHVDACVGGYLLPFLEQLNEPVPVFDFRLPAVHSISLDIHKYGYGAKGSSVVLYRNSELRKNQYYVYTEWAGGLYASPTITGTRPGGAIAAAWAIMKYLAQEGYRSIAKDTLAASKKIQTAINKIEGLKVIGNPVSPVFSFHTTDKTDIYRLGDELTDRGWHLDRQMTPPSLHLSVSQGNILFVDEFIHDLQLSVENLQKTSFSNINTSMKNSAIEKAVSILPEAWLKKIVNRSIEKMSQSENTNPKTAPLYGLMGQLSGTGTLEDMVLNLLDAMHQPDKESLQ